jgi:hypothetical protein
MEYINIILIIAFVAMCAVLLYKKFSSKKEDKSQFLGLEDEKADDSASPLPSSVDKQETQVKDVKAKMSLEERVSVSWQFFQNIVDYVMQKFSKEDRNKVEEIGNILIKYDMVYHHDIDGELSRVESQGLSNNLSQNKKRER